VPTFLLMDGPDSLDAALADAGAVVMGVGDRWLVAPDGFDVGSLGGVSGTADEASIASALDPSALVDDSNAARDALAAAFQVDASTIDDVTVTDGLGMVLESTPAFQAEFDLDLAGPLDLGGGCDRSEPEFPPSPPSTLRARRFAGDPVLEGCLAGTHRMLAPEEGRAVLRVQQALLDLGFTLPQHGADGKFGSETGQVVSTFKTQHNLQPTDPVVGKGTMATLDGLFADE
jgi:hypothetical protein